MIKFLMDERNYSMDYGDLCGLHSDSASVVKVSDTKEFIYDQYNVEFCELMNIH